MNKEDIKRYWQYCEGIFRGLMKIAGGLAAFFFVMVIWSIGSAQAKNIGLEGGWLLLFLIGFCTYSYALYLFGEYVVKEKAREEAFRNSEVRLKAYTEAHKQKIDEIINKLTEQTKENEEKRNS